MRPCEPNASRKPLTLIFSVIAVIFSSSFECLNLAEAGDSTAAAVERGTADQSKTGKAPDDPRKVRVVLDNGEILVGRLAIDAIRIRTEFGDLTVPIAELLEFKPGLHSKPQLRSKIDSLIDDLNAADSARSNRARSELIDMGTPVVGQLQRAMSTTTDEKRAAFRSVIAKLNAAQEDSTNLQAGSWPAEGTVRTRGFSIVGKIVSDDITLESKYGKLKVQLSDIRLVRSSTGSTLSDARRAMTLNGQNLAQLKFKSSGISVRKGDRIIVRADGVITRSGSSTRTSTPDGSTRLGTYQGSTLGGTLVARVGNGQIFKVGSRGTRVAVREGVLRFAIGMRPDYVGRYQFVGQYNLKIRVVRGNN